ncbi:DNA polymerase III [Myroides sp. JBRI-B21084]|uniref:DNA polymerase III n=1 Tax=Myroides sp. JBRI-B21084 TaxID=3119977 RepID=UPI0026E41355|nr:DNA polymerase III [Paenimyroides cloacae]WKW45613.1 DNA polymerase III [Paenimyroides cloacae]
MANLTLQNDVLLVEFPNEGSKLSFEENLYELVSYIHKKLNNYHLKIEVIVNEKTEIKKAFTIHDKLDYLKKINPVLENLIKTFDLEVKP